MLKMIVRLFTGVTEVETSDTSPWTMVAVQTAPVLNRKPVGAEMTMVDEASHSPAEASSIAGFEPNET